MFSTYKADKNRGKRGGTICSPIRNAFLLFVAQRFATVCPSEYTPWFTGEFSASHWLPSVATRGLCNLIYTVTQTYTFLVCSLTDCCNNEWSTNYIPGSIQLCVHLKWHPIPYIVHNLWPGTYKEKGVFWDATFEYRPWLWIQSFHRILPEISFSNLRIRITFCACVIFCTLRSYCSHTCSLHVFLSTHPLLNHDDVARLCLCRDS